MTQELPDHHFTRTAQMHSRQASMKSVHTLIGSTHKMLGQTTIKVEEELDLTAKLKLNFKK